MNDDKGRGPLLPVSGLAILLAALGFTFFTQIPFKGLRPSVTELREPFDKVSARLWQDPFRAVLDDIKARGEAGSAAGARQFWLLNERPDRRCDNETSMGIGLFKWVNTRRHQTDDNDTLKKQIADLFNESKQKADDNHTLQEMYKSIEAWRHQADDNNTLKKQIADLFAEWRHQADDNHTLQQILKLVGGGYYQADPDGSLQRQIKKRAETHKVTVLAVMVFGGPFAEATEIRIKQRYAALAGLHRAGFHPEDPEHIDYIRVAADKGKPSPSPSLSTIIPFEWLENRNGDSVLLLWLNADLFREEPVSRLARLMACLNSKPEQKPEGSIKFSIIGPPEANLLLKMLKEATVCPYPIFGGKLKIEMYSATATIDDILLLKSILKDPDPQMKKCAQESSDDCLMFEVTGKYTEQMTEECARRYVEDKFKDRGITLNRTIVSEGHLAKVLIEELVLRGVDLKAPENHVVLVAEWDTEYGRTFPTMFQRVLIEKVLQNEKGDGPGRLVSADTARRVREVSQQISGRVHRVSYLRGIDGSLPGDKAEKKDDQPDAESKREDKIKKLEEPSGKSQYDYLRRMADEMYLLDEKLISQGQSIKAIGILGTDFYDKYLMLQAFRQRFPQAIFFITDLDAWLLHPANLQYTRNLVVASSFEFSLRKDDRVDLQGDIPPFRDSYQTSLFLAVLKAFQEGNFLKEAEKEALKHPVQPLIFEIGSNGAYRLTDLKNRGVHPRRDELENTRNLFLKITVIAVVLILLIVLTSAVAFGIVKAALFTGRKRWVAAFVVLIWLFAVIYYFYGNILICPSEEPFSFSQGISVWPSALLRTLAFLLAICFLIISHRALHRNREEIYKEFGFPESPKSERSELRAEDGNLKEVTPFARFSRFARRVMEGFINFLYSCNLMSKEFWGNFTYDWEVAADKGTSMDALWQEYADRDRWRYRILRVLPIAVLFIILCSLIIQFFGKLTFPIRGTKSLLFYYVTLGSNIISFVFLTFYVFDVTRTCRQFIIKATKDSPAWHPNSVNKFATWHHIGERPDLDEWMLVHLIAKRTDAVGKLIFYPFIIWFIMWMARFNYFDNWKAPFGLVIVLSLSAVYAWSCAFFLRRAGEELRRTTIHRLKEKLVRALSESEPKQSRIKQIEFSLDEIRSIREGAFAPFSQHPSVQALLVPFGGLGGVYVFEFLSKLNI